MQNFEHCKVSEEIENFIQYVDVFLGRSNWGKFLNIIPATNKLLDFVRYLELPVLISTIEKMTVCFIF